MIEALYIRLLWVKYALRLKKTPGLCSPACREMHTYRYPCRARFHRHKMEKTNPIGTVRRSQRHTRYGKRPKNNAYIRPEGWQ
jgi:hypothetical protein